MNSYGLVICRSDDGDGGWSLHPPDAADHEIASGEAPPILSGPAHYDPHGDKWDGPTQLDYDWAGLNCRHLKESVEDSLRRWQIRCLATPTDRHLLTPRDGSKMELLRPRLERMADPLKRALLPLYATHPGIFEELIATIFECAGYDIEMRGKWNQPDIGVDFYAHSRCPLAHKIAVQCKRSKNPVGVQTIRELAGVLDVHHAHQGVIVTNSRFTREARKETERSYWRIKLLDYSDLKSSVPKLFPLHPAILIPRDRYFWT